MGVDYRASSGYGIVIPDVRLEELAESIGYTEPEWGFDTYEFGEWLVEDHDKLNSDQVGDFMNGDQLSLVIEVSRLSQHIDFYGWDGGVRKFTDITLTNEEIEQLYAVYQKLYGGLPGPQDISWFMATTVS